VKANLPSTNGCKGAPPLKIDKYFLNVAVPIRRAALEDNVPCTTTLAAAKATLHAIKTLKEGKLAVKSLQEYHEMVGKTTLPEKN